MADRSVFFEFMEEASAIVGRVAQGETRSDHTELKRDIHTLKGSSLIFGLESVGEICHGIESDLAEGAAPTPALFTRLVDRWTRLDEQVGKLLGKHRRSIEISPEEHAALTEAIRRETTSASLVRMVEGLKLEPIALRLRHFGEQARRIGTRLEKPVVASVIHDDLRLDGKVWAPFWSAFVHTIRNAVDHGIETADERLAAGKGAEGHLTLRSARQGGGFYVEVEDDGRGIDWEAVRASALKKGMRAETRDDLVRALFTDGLSTAKSVSDVSGRGVGMGALRAVVESLGGRLEVTSERGKGTRIRMTFAAAVISGGAVRSRAASGFG
jgi:two-component system, chemotaxis family, sensor kinase CheA